MLFLFDEAAMYFVTSVSYPNTNTRARGYVAGSRSTGQNTQPGENVSLGPPVGIRSREGLAQSEAFSGAPRDTPESHHRMLRFAGVLSLELSG